MNSRASFLSKRQEENFSVSFDGRDDILPAADKKVSRKRAKTCSNRCKNGVFLGPTTRIWVPHGRFFKGVKIGTLIENGPNRMAQAIQVRRLHAAKCGEKTMPRPVVKDISMDLAQICSQLPCYKKPPVNISSVTISRVKLRKHEETPTKNSKSLRSCIERPVKNCKRISVKEALRNKEWVIKAKPKILKAFFSAVNRTNGVCVEIPEVVNHTYKYYIGPGNNSRLIEKCLNTRWWWTCVDEEDIDKANFVWTQWKTQELVETLGKSLRVLEVESNLKIEIQTSVQLYKEKERPYNVDLASLGFARVTKSSSFLKLRPKNLLSAEQRVYNKLEYNCEISNKKNLFFNLKKFYERTERDPFEIIPVTFHVTGKDDEGFKDFEKFFISNSQCSENFWIIKPGENSNRGNGIMVSNDFQEIKETIKNSSIKRTFIVQKYIENPFLIKQRKFDIRCFALVTAIDGVLQGYFYAEGYIRTSSKAFTLQRNSKFIHLTNDAVQKQSEEYGRFESNNKISFAEFERYLAANYSKTVDFKDVVNNIKRIVKESIEATSGKLDQNRRMHCFEIFGYDFLLDENLKPWLLEVNTNPCLELASSHLTRIIPNMVENALRIAVDPIFLEPKSYLRHIKNNLELVENKFELVFHSEQTAGVMNRMVSESLLIPDDEKYCDDESVYSESSTDD